MSPCDAGCYFSIEITPCVAGCFLIIPCDAGYNQTLEIHPAIGSLGVSTLTCKDGKNFFPSLGQKGFFLIYTYKLDIIYIFLNNTLPCVAGEGVIQDSTVVRVSRDSEIEISRYLA